MTRTRTGLEACLAEPPDWLRGARLGLVMNQASVDDRMRYSSIALAERFPKGLKAIFSPQHGLWGEQQANMIESPHERDPRLGVPVFSLYSETRQPTAEMLSGLDCLVIDLQDVGTRVYTFLWTMLECLKACAEKGIRVLILDRPNPVGGEIYEGPLLDPSLKSFVGNFEIPLRHGLTMAELARMFQKELKIPVQLDTIPMVGWERWMLFSDTERTWVAPSPNMPRVETTLFYPGQVLLEGVNLSEGRGTTLPFELTGAPFVDAWQLHDRLQRYCHPGVLVRPIRFKPTFDKWKNERCEGISFHIEDPRRIRSVGLTVSVLACCHQLYRQETKWLPPPYEYEFEKPPIDILFGTDRLRRRFDDERPIEAEEVESLLDFEEGDWHQKASSYWLY